MGIFDSDFGGIEDLFNRLSGNFGGQRNSYTEDNGNDILETIKSRGGTYFIFDFSNKTIKEVGIKDDLRENDYGEKVHSGRKILKIKFGDGSSTTYHLPKGFKRNRFDWTSKNGILEIFFKR